MVAVTESQVLEMLEALEPCAKATEMNCSASYMLAEELLDLGKPIEEITLGELRVAYDRISERYNCMMGRLKHVRDDKAFMDPDVP